MVNPVAEIGMIKMAKLLKAFRSKSMKLRILILLCCMSFALMASAQASGGQITRKKLNSSAWSGVYSLRGSMYGSYDSDCTLILKKAGNNTYSGEIEMFYGYEEDDDSISVFDAINAPLIGKIRGESSGNKLIIILDHFSLENSDGYHFYGNLESNQPVFQISYNGSKYSFVPLGKIRKYFDGTKRRRIDKVNNSW